MCRFQAAGVGARAPRLFLSVRNIKLSGGDRGRSTDLDVQKRKEEEKSDKRQRERRGQQLKQDGG